MNRDIESGFLNSEIPGSIILLAIFLSVFFTFLSFTLQAQQHSYEAEAGALSNGAAAQHCSACSGSNQVGYLGGNLNGAITYTLDAAAEGDYALVLQYATADPRSIYISANGGSGVEVVCKPSGGWDVVATTETTVSLHEGANTIRFDNSVGWGPNIDKFTLIPGSYYTISGTLSYEGAPLKDVSVKLTGGISRTTTSNENGFYEFKDLPGNRNYTVVPLQAGKVFTPVYHDYELLSERKISQNFSAQVACTDCVRTFTFGSAGEIVYNTQTGITTVFVQGKEIISNAHAVVYNGSTLLNSVDYTDRSVSQSDLADNFGSGKKIVVSLTAGGLPDMQQIFYTYADRDYFLTEVVISAASVSSNYMAPLVSNGVDIAQTGDNRVLSVPFDNDTFIRYASKSLKNNLTNISSEVTAVYENTSRKGLIVGSVEHTDWKTGVMTSGAGSTLSELVVWGGYANVSVTRDAIPHGAISGGSIKSPKVFVGLFDDWRHGLEEYGKANALAEPRYVFDWTSPTPFGWNSWGAIQVDLTLDKAKAVASFFSNSLRGFRNGNTAYIDLDSFWDNMVSGGLEGNFGKLTEFANYCKTKGLKPGIYWGPFVDWGKYERTVEGSNYNYSEAWTKVNGAYHELDGGRAMDPTHPATLQRIKYVIDKFKKCGFEMIKIDFIGHATVEADHFYDPSVTTGMQAFRKGMEYLVDQMNGTMLVYAAISPNLATGRYVHMRRIACDAFSDIGATEYTLNSTTYGWWQTYVYNYIDADHLVLAQQSIGENRARFTSGIVNGTLITGDDFSKFGQWTARAESLFQNQEVLEIAKNGKAFTPVEGNSNQGASEMFEKQIGDNYYLAILNYGGEKSFDISMNRLGVKDSGYQIKELYNGATYSVNGSSLKITVGSKDAVILRFSKAIINSAAPEMRRDTAAFYPNPTSQVVKVSSRNAIRSLKVASVNGKVLNVIENINRYEYSVDLSKQSRGIYWITLTEVGGAVKSYKIVKE